MVVVRAPAPGWTADRPFDEATELIIKRVTAVSGTPRPDGSGPVPPEAVYVEGDAPGGYDSRVFGPLPLGELVGRVRLRVRWADRYGHLTG